MDTPDSAVKNGAATPNSLGDEKTKEGHEHSHHNHLPHLHIPHGHGHGRRFLEFVHPHTGKTVHVCHSPEHLERKRSELLREKKVEEFDVILQGTPEHLEAVRDLHAHHQSRRDELRDRHGELYTDIETVKADLDALAAELHHITAHAVSLDASFDRYGYSAHLRTKDDDSETMSVHTNDHPSAVERHKDRSAEPLRFLKRPVIRQYFHKGLLWRSAKAGEVASFELFLDLVYVGVIDIVGEKAVEGANGLSLLHFVIIFSIAWKIWADLTMIINHFEIDDIFQRIYVIFYLVCLFGFTTNIAYAFESTYTSAIAFYLTQRLFNAVWFIYVAWILPTIRGSMVLLSALIVISSAFWIGSIHVQWPGQLSLIFIAIFIDIFGNIIVIWFVKQTQSGVLRGVMKYFEFSPAINIEHRVERNNAFVSLVFGYSILTILFQSHASFGINAFFGKGVLGLIQAFMFNWIYFEIDAYHVHVHAIRRHWVSASLWVSAHLPFIMGYVLAASTLSRLVLAHDSADADPEWLGEGYAERSESEVPTAFRWFYCGGLGVALICMAAISLSHIHKRVNTKGKTRLRKRPRLVFRVCVAAVIICLPLAKSLSSLSLISITTALVFSVLALDLFGMSRKGDKFWTGGFCPHEKKNTTYTAQCRLGKRRRREIEKAMQRGEKVGLADLLKRKNSSMSSLESEETLRDEEWQGGHF
ncbi:hypothetical protein PV08_09556 [Exophiala spinifera]|uniref:Uncharacterized protein n=1 Tax=Exophiala spinifera TaxID=91928 RepID=A0A0D2BM61_9EURO|nr:uncharacterized protein PV08_09556 [Exophiala spinifera]KIW12279.1 hypothetical protein PV08_09556 [Exophiala spinifera]